MQPQRDAIWEKYTEGNQQWWMSSPPKNFVDFDSIIIGESTD